MFTIIVSSFTFLSHRVVLANHKQMQDTSKLSLKKYPMFFDCEIQHVQQVGLKMSPSEEFTQDLSRNHQLKESHRKERRRKKKEEEEVVEEEVEEGGGGGRRRRKKKK